jgi:hypothetical protein
MRVLASGLALVASTFVAAPLAAADDYPTAYLDRPLTLEPGTLQPNAALSLVHNGAAMDPAPSNIEALELGADYGILHHLQAGAVVDINLSPSKFVRALASGQYQLLVFAALRVDIGAQRIDNGNLDFAFGIGLPLHLKLTDAFALISSRPYAYGAEDDVFSFRAGSDGTISETRLPLGIMYQLNPHVAFVGRSGFRKQENAYFVPLGADALLTVSRLDVGISLDVAGQVSPSGGPGFADLLSVRGFAQVRI